jgi:hypothetical protein
MGFTSFLTFPLTTDNISSVKRVDRKRKDAEIVMDKIRAISRHIRGVEDNCLILGEKLIAIGAIDLGHKLIANGFIHDSSKFHGIEWEYMAPGQPTVEESAKIKLKIAVQHHSKTNPHHPEYWDGGIKDMPRLYLAEMVCDWKARSEEFGTNLREWIDNVATKKFNFTKEDHVYGEIKDFVELLCPKPFENLNQKYE